MAYKREIFTIVEDSTGEGVSLQKKIVGDAATSGVNNIPVVTFKDNSGNFVYPQLDADGKLPVSFEGAGSDVSATGKATPVGLNTDTDVATITLTASTEYDLAGMHVAARFPTEFRLEHNDNGSPVVLARTLVGAGAYSSTVDLPNISFTAGGSGTQELKIIAQQLNGALSDVVGTVAALEKA